MSTVHPTETGRPRQEPLPRALLLGVSQPGLDALAKVGVPFDVVGLASDLRKLADLDPMGLGFAHEADFTNPAELLRVPFDVRAYQRVVSFTELGLLPAAMCNALAGDTHDLAAVYLTRHKSGMRRRLIEAGLSNIRFGFGPPKQRDRAAMLDSTPVITKPVDGASSVGLALVAAEDFERIHADAYWEEYISGTELSVEAVSRNGVHHVLGTTRKFHTMDGRFIEVGHVFPATLEPRVSARLPGFVANVLDALGVVSGASHTEVKVDDRSGELEVIEAHTRPGGDAIPQLVELVTGRDQYREAIEAELGTELADGAATPCSASTKPTWAMSVFGLGGVSAHDVLSESGARRDLTVVDQRVLPGGGQGSDARDDRMVLSTTSRAAMNAIERALEGLYGGAVA